MATLLPEILNLFIKTALEEMNANPQHRLAYQRRSQIYSALRDCPSGQYALALLAINTAVKVFPIFQQEFPEDTLPKELLNAAVGVLNGKIDDLIVDEIQEHGYHASGNAWGHVESEISWNADLAGRAAYHALQESRGQKPFAYLDKQFKLGIVIESSGEYIKYPSPISAVQFTDEDLCQSSNSDTAAIAAVAFACEPDSPLCDPLKLQEFWVWWLLTAISEAWESSCEKRA